MASAVAKCMMCPNPLASETEHSLHLCKDHLEEQREDYGVLPPVLPDAEVVWEVQVEEGENPVVEYETSAAYSANLDVVRVEIYEGVKARVVLFDRESRAPVVWCFPWHKVLQWQEA